jgi:hypothetical protein
MRAKSKIRPVYALAEQASIKKDDEALPPKDYLAGVLNKTASSWLKRNQKS